MEKKELNQEKIKELKEQLKIEKHKIILSKASVFSSEYKKQVSTAIMTAFGLVIALSWKDVVTALLPSITTPSFLENYPLLTSLYTAIIITLVAVIGIVLVANWSKPSETK